MVGSCQWTTVEWEISQEELTNLQYQPTVDHFSLLSPLKHLYWLGMDLAKHDAAILYACICVIPLILILCCWKYWKTIRQKETKSTFTCACCLPGMNMGFLDKVVKINTKPTTSVCENFNVFQMLMSTSRIKWKLWLLEDILNSRKRSCVKSKEMEVNDQNASTSCTCSSYQEFLPRRFQK